MGVLKCGVELPRECVKGYSRISDSQQTWAFRALMRRVFDVLQTSEPPSMIPEKRLPYFHVCCCFSWVSALVYAEVPAATILFLMFLLPVLHRPMYLRVMHLCVGEGLLLFSFSLLFVFCSIFFLRRVCTMSCRDDGSYRLLREVSICMFLNTF